MSRTINALSSQLKLFIPMMMPSAALKRPLPRQRHIIRASLLSLTCLAAAIPAVVPTGAVAATTVASLGKPEERSLRFYHTHTGERLEIVYFRQGDYSNAALSRINHFLRDFRTGDKADIDPQTLDIVHQLNRQLDYRGDVHIVSAYRSPKTNEMLRKRGSGVAKKSQHLEGKAIDFRLPGIDTAQLRDMAKALQQGGVGYYRASDFIHVDSGRVRYW